MPRKLTRGPFTLEDARRAGLERWHLEGASWRRWGPRTYVWVGLADTPMVRLEAVRQRLPAAAVFSGLTAAWLHSIDVEPCHPIEVTVPGDIGVTARSGAAVRRAALDHGDVCTVRGMPATSLVRTVADVCCRLDLVEAVVVADMALHTGRLRLGQLSPWAKSHAGRRGIRTFKRVIGFAEPAAESPMETRLRMLLVLNRLPRPHAQVPIHNRWGQFVGRPDLYYEAHRLGIEYDGGIHRESLADDDRRQNRLLGAGIRLLRFTASDVLNDPNSVVAQVRAQITASEHSRGIHGHR